MFLQSLVTSLAASGPLVSASARRAGEAQAEYSIHWLANGSPVSTAALVFSLLGKRPGKKRESEVCYYRATEGHDSAAIFRARTGDASNVVWKVRVEGLDLHATAGGLTCPLPGDVTKKTEVDVAVTSKNSERRMSSRSCTTEELLKKTLPPVIKLMERGCASRMVRADGRVILEASSKGKGKDSAAALTSFKKEVAHKLIDAKVAPSELSKTELVMQC